MDEVGSTWRPALRKFLMASLKRIFMILGKCMMTESYVN